MAGPSKFHIVVLTISALIALQYVNAEYASKLNTSQNTVIGSSVIAVGVSVLPSIVPHGVQKLMPLSTQQNDKNQFVYIDSLNEEGESIQFKLPQEAIDKVQIQKNDRVSLRDGADNETILYINGEAKNLFILKK